MKMTKTYTVQEALLKLSKYCTYQDRCHQEVEQKLREMNMIPQARDEIISQLIKHDFLNEQRFALNYARGKFNQKHWGRIRIRQELKRRNITEKLIQKALDQISEKEYVSKLKNIARKKFEEHDKDKSLKAKARLKNYLLYKGYESQLVFDELFFLMES